MDHLQAVNTLAMERYLLDEMAEAERDAFEAHYFSCAECAEDARFAVMMRDGAASGVARLSPGELLTTDKADVLAFRANRTGWRSSVVLPWAAAAMLAIGVGYQTVRGPVFSRETIGTVALAPSTLRPASRGQEPVVVLGSGGILTLAVDLGGAQFDTGIRYELRGEAGRTIASGTAETPVAGAPLLLMVAPRRGHARRPLRADPAASRHVELDAGQLPIYGKGSLISVSTPQTR